MRSRWILGVIALLVVGLALMPSDARHGTIAAVVAAGAAAAAATAAAGAAVAGGARADAALAAVMRPTCR